MSLTLLSYNIRYGGTGRERQLAEAIRACDADIVLLQEATLPRVVERVAAEAGMRAWAATRGYSLAFMSRVRVERHEWLRPRGGRLVPRSRACWRGLQRLRPAPERSAFELD